MMAGSYLRLNIHNDCDFGIVEFGRLANITFQELDDKESLNQKLKDI